MPTQQFRWIDRDTAARDLLQLVYHAPGHLHEQALKLLEAIRSPAVLPALKEIVLDSDYDVRQRRVALDAIIATPGNMDFHEFAPDFAGIYDPYNASLYAALLLKNHPVNLMWILKDVEQWSPNQQFHTYLRILKYMPQVAIEPLLKFLDENPDGLTLETAEMLYKYGGETVHDWLRERWDEVIRLWLTYTNTYFESHDFWKRVHLRCYLDNMLKTWPELEASLSQITLSQLLNCSKRETLSVQCEMYLRLLKYAPQVAAELLLKLLDTNPGLLNLETADLMHRFGDESIQNWLHGRWDELIYLCLIDGVVAGKRINGERVWLVYVLESWSELKDALFHNCPAIVEEYNLKKALYDETDFQSIDEEEIKVLPIWQTLHQRYDKWIERKKNEPRRSISLPYLRLMPTSEADIPLIAAEIYFLGSLIPPDDIPVDKLKRLLEVSGDEWRTRVYLHIWDDITTFVYSPIRFEAAYALRNTANSGTWELFIEASLVPRRVFWAMTNSMFERQLLHWIARLTDQLSGIEPEQPVEEVPLNWRPWFGDLVKKSKMVAPDTRE